MKNTLNKPYLLEEMRAIDRRQDALDKGIIPAADSNWNAARNNKKLIQKSQNFRNDISLINRDITRDNSIPKNSEYSGTVQNNGKIKSIDHVGDDSSVMINQKSINSFHKHPSLAGGDNVYNNIPSRPSGKIGVGGDLDAYKILLNNNKQHSRSDYIGSPNSIINNASVINTKNKKSDVVQNTTHFADNAKKHYNLNGQRQSDFINPMKDKINNGVLDIWKLVTFLFVDLIVLGKLP